MMRTVFKRFGAMIMDWMQRVRRAWVWIVLQFAGLAMLIALGLLWTRIPEKHVWQVLLTLLVPLILVAAFLVLQAGTFRSFLHPARAGGSPRIALGCGAATLLIWIAVGWALWALLDRFDDHTWSWAIYLSSKAGQQDRVHWASYGHLNRYLGWAGWTLRWVIVPGLLMPLASSAAWGLRHLPWRRVLRLFIDWRWWPGVLFSALVGEAWPQTWFDTEPHGTVHQQVMRVILKVAAAYLLATWCWVRLLGWSATLLDDAPPADGTDDGGEPVPEPALVGPLGGKHASVRLPLPDADEGVGGNA